MYILLTLVSILVLKWSNSHKLWIIIHPLIHTSIHRPSSDGSLILILWRAHVLGRPAAWSIHTFMPVLSCLPSPHSHWAPPQSDHEIFFKETLQTNHAPSMSDPSSFCLSPPPLDPDQLCLNKYPVFPTPPPPIRNHHFRWIVSSSDGLVVGVLFPARRQTQTRRPYFPPQKIWFSAETVWRVLDGGCENM